MPALDIIHHAVKNALVRDGWTITADPFRIDFGKDTVYIDLAGERRLAAERNGVKIAVEIESFIGRSQLHDFEVALGQYMFYLSILERMDPTRKLYLAISKDVHEQLFRRDIVELATERYRLQVVVVNLQQEEVVAWIN